MMLRQSSLEADSCSNSGQIGYCYHSNCLRGGRSIRSTGFVRELNKPGGNLTGVTNLNVEITAKRLELVRELIPEGDHCRFARELKSCRLGAVLKPGDGEHSRNTCSCFGSVNCRFDRNRFLLELLNRIWMP